MRAKVKISVISTGQEFLLLVAKMNLKGILVFSPQILPPDSELILELKLGVENPIMLKGFVHKVSEDDASKRGMVIAFLNPSEDTKKTIQDFIQRSQGEPEEKPLPKKEKVKETKKEKILKAKKQAQTKKSEDDEIIRPEKTVIVDNTLPALSLQSPDNSRELLVSTKDEENVHHAGKGLGGETRHVQIHETLTRRKKPTKPFQFSTVYKALGIVLVLVGVVVFFRHGVGWVEKTFDIQLVPDQVKTVTNPNQPLPTVTPQVPSTSSNAPASGSLDSVTVEDQGDFMKITLLGEGNYNDFTVEKLKDPYRLVFSFNSLDKLNATMPMNVNNNPVKTIEAKSENNKIIMTIFMLKKEFMEFDAKPFPNAMDIFFYRE
ncbi:MAG: hypothetical protein KDD46_06395 [Bdellovibrionales bacterium]|nr:hypothetical protein [Bdellovibrionales bacterium]